jgi:hypothetical protein
MLAMKNVHLAYNQVNIQLMTVIWISWCLASHNTPCFYNSRRTIVSLLLDPILRYVSPYHISIACMSSVF